MIMGAFASRRTLGAALLLAPLTCLADSSLEVYGFGMVDYVQGFARVTPEWEDTLRPGRIPDDQDQESRYGRAGDGGGGRGVGVWWWGLCGVGWGGGWGWWGWLVGLGCVVGVGGLVRVVGVDVVVGWGRVCACGRMTSRFSDNPLRSAFSLEASSA